jgi:nickel-dependent lactate racemase
MSEDMSRRRFLEMAAAISAGTASSFGKVVAAGELGLPAEQVTVLRSKNPAGGKWPDVVSKALANPLGAPKLRSHNLQGKRIAVMTDDWGRPTPASEFIPTVLEELHAAGAEDAKITFVTASGMHVPMNQADLERKLGKETVRNFRCISHDAGDWNMLAFAGTSDLGTPIWVNRYVAEADFRVALGRIAPHEAYGYEGGYKMIVPGVSSFETILRDHSMNFSAYCVPGVHGNPSRREADSIGAKVGIHFVVNIVVNRQDEPVRAFAGKVELVHPQGIQFGDREVWGAVTPYESRITVLTLGPGEPLREELPSEMLRRAATVTREAGTIICESKADRIFKAQFGDGAADEETLNTKDVASFNAMLSKLSLSEIMRIHEKRDWRLDRRTIQHRVKAIRSRYYLMRNLMPLQSRQVLLTPNPTATFQTVMAKLPKNETHVNVLVGGTLPRVQAT